MRVRKRVGLCPFQAPTGCDVGSLCITRKAPGQHEAAPGAGGSAGKPGFRDALAVERDVQALAFMLFVDAEADDSIDDLEKDQRRYGAINDRGDDAVDLSTNLTNVAFECPGRTTDRFDGEHAG